jgi:hypothetical protein
MKRRPIILGYQKTFRKKPAPTSLLIEASVSARGQSGTFSPGLAHRCAYSGVRFPRWDDLLLAVLYLRPTSLSQGVL